MIWIATEDGLNRYDGNKFSIYKHDARNKQSLQHNLVRCLFEDNKGNLLLGCYNGVQMYNPATDTFSAPAIKENGEPYANNVNLILQRSNGEIWISGSQLSILTINENQLIAKPVDLPLPTNVTDCIMEDKSGNMWVVVKENKIFRISPNQQIKEYPLAHENVLITTLGQDSYGNIYAGTIDNGLFRLDYNKECFIPIEIGRAHV